MKLESPSAVPSMAPSQPGPAPSMSKQAWEHRGGHFVRPVAGQAGQPGADHGAIQPAAGRGARTRSRSCRLLAHERLSITVVAQVPARARRGKTHARNGSADLRLLRLTRDAADRYRRCMAHTFMIFDFGSDEEAAQQARHKVEGWKQGFRLGNKLMVKFDRGDEKAADAGQERQAGRAGDRASGFFRPREAISPALAGTHSCRKLFSATPSRRSFGQGDPDFADAAKRFDALDRPVPGRSPPS